MTARLLLRRLGELLFLSVMLVLTITDVRTGHAFWSLLNGVAFGLWLGVYFVEFVLWRKRQRVKKRVVAALTDGDQRLRVLE